MGKRKKIIIISIIILIAIFTLPILPKKIYECKNTRPFDKESLSNNYCICPDVILPVCGIDNKTYENGCNACCNGQDYTKGECGKSQKISIIQLLINKLKN